jgi:hypothetical protein
VEIELIRASLKEKPILANLLELYSCDFDIGDNGFMAIKI